MSNNDEKLFHKISDARQVLSQGIDTMQALSDPDDKLTTLKTSYQIALTYVPDTLARKYKLYLIKVDKYMDMLNMKRADNLYEMQSHKTEARVKQDAILHKRQEALIKFQKYCLIHGRLYQDDIVVLDKNNRIVSITADQFYDYIKPYQDFLQKEFKRLHPDIKK